MAATIAIVAAVRITLKLSTAVKSGRVIASFKEVIVNPSLKKSSLTVPLRGEDGLCRLFTNRTTKFLKVSHTSSILVGFLN